MYSVRGDPSTSEMWIADSHLILLPTSRIAGTLDVKRLWAGLGEIGIARCQEVS